MLLLKSGLTRGAGCVLDRHDRSARGSDLCGLPPPRSDGWNHVTACHIAWTATTNYRHKVPERLYPSGIIQPPLSVRTHRRFGHVPGSVVVPQHYRRRLHRDEALRGRFPGTVPTRGGCCSTAITTTTTRLGRAGEQAPVWRRTSRSEPTEDPRGRYTCGKVLNLVLCVPRSSGPTL